MRRRFQTALVVILAALLAACSTSPAARPQATGAPTAAAEPQATGAPTAAAGPQATGAPTAAAESAQAEQVQGTIRIGVNGPARPIDPRILGTNVPAWLNTDGLSNPTFLSRTVSAGPKVIRMPGGSWSNTYGWLSCQTERASPCEYAARPSDFIDLLQATGAEGMWTVSFNGTAEEAAALVAFFNGAVGDPQPIGVDPRGTDWKTVGDWAQLRADTGHADPVGLKLWEVGNEVYGGKAGTGKDCADWGWEDGWTCDGTEYVEGEGVGTERRQGFHEFREAMRAVDATILVGAIGIPRQSDWNNWGNEVIAAAGQEMDFYSIHQYAFFEPPGTIEEALAEPQQTWKAIIADIRGAFETYAGGRDVPVAVTEFNLFSVQENDKGKLMTSAVNMLHLADTIGQLADNGFVMANQWNLANGTTDEFGNYGLLDGVSWVRYPQYYVFPLWGRFGNQLLPVDFSFDASADLSIYAGRADERVVSLMVINKGSGSRTATISVEGVSEVSGGTADIAQAENLEAMQVRFNGEEEPADDLSNAEPIILKGVSQHFNYTFTPYSITLLRLNVTP